MENDKLRVTLADGSVLKQSLSLVSNLITETKLAFKQNGIELVALDPANVAMVSLMLKGNMFTEYNIPQETSIGINLANLKDVLKRMSSKDIVTLEINDSKLNVKYLGAGRNKEFNLATLELEEKGQKMPELKFSTSVTTLSEILRAAVDDVEIVGESALFSADKDKLIISSEGDLNKAVVDVQKDDTTIIKCNGKAKVTSKFAVEYLKKFVEASSFSDHVSIFLEDNYPLKLLYSDADFELCYILAPRVED